MCCSEGWRGGLGQSRDCGKEAKAWPSASARVCVYTLFVRENGLHDGVDPNAFVPARAWRRGQKGRAASNQADAKRRAPPPLRRRQQAPLSHPIQYLSFARASPLVECCVGLMFNVVVLCRVVAKAGLGVLRLGLTCLTTTTRVWKAWRCMCGMTIA